MNAPRPLVVLVTATSVVPESELFARLDAVASLPLDARRRFAVMLRDPELGGGARLRLGRRLADWARAHGSSLWVNDRLDLALALGAAGVHLGRRSVRVADARALLGPGPLLSVACHDVADVRRAAEERADVVTLSPIFESPGKGPALGLEALRQARGVLGSSGGPALLALGGVSPESARSCVESGADGVAMIRGDPGSTLTALIAR